RFVTLALKMVTDLERIGDLAVNICERAIDLAQDAPLEPWVDVPRMAGIVQGMVRDAIDAFLAGDAARARSVVERDQALDALYFCEGAISLAQEAPHGPWVDVPRMSGVVQGMVRDAIDAFVAGDADRACSVVERDQARDALYIRVFRELLSAMLNDTSKVER